MISRFTVLIQGPLNPESQGAIENYKKYGDVVISSWDDSKLPSIPEGLLYISKPVPDRKSGVGFDRSSTWYWALHSQKNGFDVIESEYTIKVRSDERCLNLNPFVDTLLENPDKLVCGNIFAKKWDATPYHIGDHIYAVKTDKMRRALSWLADMYAERRPLEGWAVQGPNTAEQVLAHSFIHANRVGEVDLSKKETMLENFHVVDINRTEKFLAHWRCAGGPNGQHWEDVFDNPHGVRCQEDV